MTRTRVIQTLLAAVLGVLGPIRAAQAQRVYWDDPGPLGAGQRGAIDLVFADTQPAGRVVPPHVDDLTIAGQSGIQHFNRQRPAQRQRHPELSDPR